MKSRPTWGVWIEIVARSKCAIPLLSRPTWGVWIEIFMSGLPLLALQTSRPTWGVWIEIL